MTKIVEFENVYIELPEVYVKEEETEVEKVIDVEEPEISIEPLEETPEETPVVEEEPVVPEEPVEETPAPEETPVSEPEESKIIIDLPVKDKILENALKDIEEAEKQEEKKEPVEDPAVTKSATTKLSFEELQKRLEETQALHL